MNAPQFYVCLRVLPLHVPALPTGLQRNAYRVIGSEMKRWLGQLLVVFAAIIVVGAAWSAYSWYREVQREEAGFVQVANRDAIFWLMQGPPNNRHIPCSVHYRFDAPVDPELLLERLQAMAAKYDMFRRNVVEFDGLPYWQTVEPDWSENFRILEPGEDLNALRAEADIALSQAAQAGEGLPLFRAYLSADRRELVFVWHHVISDFEGMFNKHALDLFELEGERTQFGYQLVSGDSGDTRDQPDSAPQLGVLFDGEDRPLGFSGSDFAVERIVLPIKDVALAELGERAGLPMSDILSFITLRAVTIYHQDDSPDNRAKIKPVVSPLSLRKSSLATDEGNNRTSKSFPIVFPLESVADMRNRLAALPPSTISYEESGRGLKNARRFRVLEPAMREISMPDYISNYFPLADGALMIGEAKVVEHDLRVPMVPYERVKFAWSNYDGEMELFLHTDPALVDTARMSATYQQAAQDVLAYLRSEAATSSAGDAAI